MLLLLFNDADPKCYAAVADEAVRYAGAAYLTLWTPTSSSSSATFISASAPAAEIEITYRDSPSFISIPRAVTGINAVRTRHIFSTVFTFNIGALIITYIILGVPYYTYSIMGPKPYSNY